MPNSNKNIIYVADNNTNIYAKFQLHPPYDFWEDDFFLLLFFFFFSKINILVAMATNQTQRFGQNSYGL